MLIIECSIKNGYAKSIKITLYNCEIIDKILFFVNNFQILPIIVIL